MYSRKFGLRLRGKCGNLLKTADYPDVTDWGKVVSPYVGPYPGILATAFSDMGLLR